MKADIFSLDAKKVGTVEKAGKPKKTGEVDLPEHIFGLEPRADILHRMVCYQLAKRRAGTVRVKDRSDVIGSGAKIYRQKGTGRARHGSRKVNLFRGGGKSFGPKPRDHAIGLPKKVRALALRHALSAKARAEELVVLDGADMAEPKTGLLRERLAALGLANALIIDGAEVAHNFSLAARNIPNIDVLPVQGLNVYDILRRDKLVLTKAALAAIEERFQGAASGGGSKSAGEERSDD